MSAPMLRRQRPRFQTRPFFISTALIFSLVAIHRLVPGIVGPSSATATSPGSLLLRRNDEYPIDLECRLVHDADDKCAFVLANCEDEAAGLLPYISFYYCSMQHVQPLAFVMLVSWLGLLFTTIGIAASDFFSVNLGTIANIMGLSESLAGVTFLAFGNGSPDVFSTFAAMGSNSGSMAVGELIGAAGFITGVVAGSMALVREFKVSRRTFIRDICFFIASVAFAMVFLADGKLMFWECCVMIGFYIFYVMTVVGWHWVSTRRNRRRAREAASRGHFYGAVGATGDGDDDLAPYHDDNGHGGGGEDGSDNEAEPDDTAVVGGRRERPPPDISALECGPRIEVDSVESPGQADQEFDSEALDVVLTEEQQERHNRHITAEMTSSMRVNRPRGRRSTTSMNPIRPSLLGALEFRSVLASLQRSGTMHLAPIVRRRLTASGSAGQRPPSLNRGYSASALSGFDDNMSRSSLLPQDAYRSGTPPSRDRALSSGDRPLSWAASQSVPDFPPYSDFELARDASIDAALNQTSAQPSGSDAQVAPETATGEVTSPGGTSNPVEQSTGAASPVPTSFLPKQNPSRMPSGLHLEIPTSPQQLPRHSPHSSPSLSPFPGYSESPLPFSPLPPSRTSSMPLMQQAGAQRDDGSSFPGIDDNTDIPKPVKWWPYDVLPPPHIILCTLFPTLVGWHEKTIWDKFVSLISAPTVFLLVITLPVVEMETQCDDDEDDVAGAELEANEAVVQEPVIAGTSSTPALALPGAETEWQRYRRSTNTMRPLPSPVLRAVQDEDGDSLSSTAVSVRSSASAVEGAPIVDLGHRGLHPHQYSDHLRADETPLLHHQHHHHHNHNGHRENLVPAIPATVPNVQTKPADPALVTAMSEAETISATGWNRWLVAVQLFAGPIFTALVIWANTMEEMERPGRDLFIMLIFAVVVATGMLAVLFYTTTPKQRPKYHSLLCFLGFVISVAWISTVAGEVVGVLKAIGVIVGISEAILGLTIFAVGNSLGDLVADITVARLGYPVMALSACFGGPMLNILLGVGIGGAWMTTKAANDRESSHPGQPRQYEPYIIQVGSTLLVSAVTVLVTLVFLLVAVPANKWMMTRRIGLTLIGMWTVSTILNVVLEVSGAWR
ncbi:sodium calcium exchanger protein [Ophiostoma piceae UAMH 11346]|uniref:Sodium calcium exchanger protein n=1 Tax=Ophiostoma piceae (strain UAMH 11346) TaxID=1262450 RepID=S3BWZ2_OPHP1|nr:sodium calcium exchanger protein [Ophiostoma piceae UAMH 11346]